MKHLTYQEVEELIYITLSRVPAITLQALRSKDSFKRDKARDDVTAMIAAKVSNNSYCVVRADRLRDGGIEAGLGKFGVDEPWPGIDKPM